jgi:hypothetical protein
VIATVPARRPGRDAGRVTPTASIRPVHGGRSRRDFRRRDLVAARSDRDGCERESFGLCLVALEEAIAQAERWCQRRERALADFDRRAADMVRRLRDAGMVAASTTWEAA